MKHYLSSIIIFLESFVGSSDVDLNSFFNVTISALNRMVNKVMQKCGQTHDNILISIGIFSTTKESKFDTF